MREGFAPQSFPKTARDCEPNVALSYHIGKMSVKKDMGKSIAKMD